MIITFFSDAAFKTTAHKQMVKIYITVLLRKNPPYRPNPDKPEKNNNGRALDMPAQLIIRMQRLYRLG
jgi:hypothetical protein